MINSENNSTKTDTNVMVSICCLTYNHENYIKDALDSFLMQQTNFVFEVLIHDDASTDNTAKIIEQYKKLYPEIIKPIIQTENQRSKLGGGMNPRFNYPRAQGKYIALCEGDDYWTDPTKLQKQVDFLEANEEFTLVAGNSLLIDEKGAKIRENLSKERPIHLKQILKKNILGSATASLFFRKDCLDSKYSTLTSKFPFGDWLLSAYCISKGKGYILEDVLSAYRVHQTGVWSSMNQEKRIKQNLLVYKLFGQVFPQHGLVLKTARIDFLKRNLASLSFIERILFYFEWYFFRVKVKILKLSDKNL